MRTGACLAVGTTGDGCFAGLAMTDKFANTHSEHAAATKETVFSRGLRTMVCSAAIPSHILPKSPA